MEDLREARRRVRELIEPLHHRVSNYELKEKLGNMLPGQQWEDDLIVVGVSFECTPTREFPVLRDADLQSTFHGVGETRAQAIEEAYTQVVREADKWRRAIALDQAFKGGMGKEIRSLKQRALPQHPGKPAVILPEGLQGTVVGHQPGRLLVDFGTGLDPIRIPFWMFTAYYSRAVDRDAKMADMQFVDVPDPYYEFVDGYKPWEGGCSNLGSV
jgi:hypothetical protein